MDKARSGPEETIDLTFAFQFIYAETAALSSFDDYGMRW
jgi:hypothetical protein